MRSATQTKCKTLYKQANGRRQMQRSNRMQTGERFLVAGAHGPPERMASAEAGADGAAGATGWLPERARFQTKRTISRSADTHGRIGLCLRSGRRPPQPCQATAWGATLRRRGPGRATGAPSGGGEALR